MLADPHTYNDIDTCMRQSTVICKSIRIHKYPLSTSQETRAAMQYESNPVKVEGFTASGRRAHWGGGPTLAMVAVMLPLLVLTSKTSITVQYR